VGLRHVATGGGEHFSLEQDTAASEKMPKDWNLSAPSYSLKYRHRDTKVDKFVLKAAAADDGVELTLMRISDEVTKTALIKIKDNLDATGKNVRNEEALLKEIQKELLKPFLPEAAKAERSSEASGAARNPSNVNRPVRMGMAANCVDEASTSRGGRGSVVDL